MTSRQQTPLQSTGAHRRPKAPAGRSRAERDRDQGRDLGRAPGGEAARGGDLDGDHDLGPGGDRGLDPGAGHGRDGGRDFGRDFGRDVGRDRGRTGGRDLGREDRDGLGRRRSGGRPHRTQPAGRAARYEHYEPYLDGLFTYCLSILCEHDAACAALGEVLAVAERQRTRLRDPALRRPWLYALARWSCLRRLTTGRAPAPRVADDVAEQRRTQLAALAWPEAAGTTPGQREALELAVRHQLTPAEVGHVLGVDGDAARARLARAACEVERTRTALAVVDTGTCPHVAGLAGGTRVLLGTALRTELVRHVDACTACRRTAERVVAAGPWPGAADAAAVLPVIKAPRSAVHAATLHAAAAGRNRGGTPRFDRRGFPLDVGDRAARRARMRHRAVTTTVVAAVVAAPVLAVWAAYRAAPLGDEARGSGRAASASDPDGMDGASYEKTGSTVPSPGRSGGASRSDATSPDAASSPTVTVSEPSSAAAGPGDGASRFSVSAAPAPGATRITLTAQGTAPVRWAARTSAYWLHMSARSGVLRPGESITLVVTVDRSLEPGGAWTAVISFTPADARVTLHGSSARSVPPPVSSTPTPTGSGTTSAPPTATPPTSPPPTTPPPTSTPPTSPTAPSDSPTPSDSTSASP